jgi:hypothetical protein
MRADMSPWPWNLVSNPSIVYRVDQIYILTPNVIIISAMIASIIKTVQIRVLVSVDSDPTVATADLERWLYIETYLVIITTSIPCLRSLIRTRKSSSNNSYITTRPSRVAPSRGMEFSIRPGNQVSISESDERGFITKKTSGSRDCIIGDTANGEFVDFDDWKHTHRSFSCERISNDIP